MDPIRFNCGEYRPGQEPIFIPPITTTVPPVIIPGVIIVPGRPTWLPQDPPPPDPPITPVKIPPFSSIQPPIRFPSDKVPPVSDIGTPGTGIPGRPGTGSIPGTGAVRPGNTGLPSRYLCNDIIIYCPDDIKKPLEQRRIKDIRRFCVVCYQQRNAEGVLFWPPGCIYRTKQDCENACRDSLGINLCIDVGQAQVEPAQVSTQQNTEPTLVVNTSVVQNTISVANSILTQTTNPSITKTNINLSEIAQSQYQSVVTNQTSQSSGTLYSNAHNIIAYAPTHETTLVSNGRYTNIFNSIVAREVGYFIERQNSISPWDEKTLFNLTNEKVLLSLNRQLTTALNNLHYLGGIPVNINHFLEAIKKHLIEGTLDWFDSNFFISLYEKQKNDKFITYSNGNSKDILTRGALGLISEGSIPADSSLFTSIQKNQLRRQRRLNEDIGSTLNACTIDGTEYQVELANAGIEACTINGISYCEIGDGDGYYLEAATIDSCEAVPLNTNISAVYYVPPQTRFNALSIMNLDPNINLKATSLSGNNEIVSGYSPVHSTDPKYFMLELSSVVDSPTSDPLVNRTYGKYVLVENEEVIQRETLNNGFAVSRVNINFDDPIIKYALDSSSIELEQNDITFRNFDENRTSYGQNIISRNIPFGLILTPVLGSKHNPFNGNSYIERYTDGYVTRSISMIPSIDNSEKDNLRSPLKEVNLFNSVSSLKVGVSEPNDAQGIAFLFDPDDDSFTSRFFSATEYTNDSPNLSSFGYSYMITEILDPLIANNDPEELTWWDIYCRMPLNRFGELLYDRNDALHNALSNGFRSDIKIKSVLARAYESDLTFIEDDNIILRSENRYAPSR